MEEEEEEQDPYGELGDLEANDLMKFAYEISTGMVGLRSIFIPKNGFSANRPIAKLFCSMKL